MVARHEGERDGTPDPSERTGRLAAGVDAAGAALGSLGLLAFGTVIWLLAVRLPAWETLTCAALAWTVVSGLAWIIRQRL